MTGDILARSNAHWSEAGRAGMDAFYRLATDDYRHLALARDWPAWIGASIGDGGGGPLRLLDVACGSGKFPNALVRHGGLDRAGMPELRTDLLDPSAFSIAEARAALPAPFVPADAHETTLQDFAAPPDGYDIVWAVHALYAVPEAELDAAVRAFLAAIAPGGRGFVAHSAAAGHYVAFHARYLAAFGAPGAAPYVSAERLADALRAAGATVEVSEITYDSRAPLEEVSAVEGYLQRCVFDDAMSLDRMRTDPGLAAYLDGCRAADGWRFGQVVHLLDIAV